MEDTKIDLPIPINSFPCEKGKFTTKFSEIIRYALTEPEHWTFSSTTNSALEEALNIKKFQKVYFFQEGSMGSKDWGFLVKYGRKKFAMLCTFDSYVTGIAPPPGVVLLGKNLQEIWYSNYTPFWIKKSIHLKNCALQQNVQRIEPNSPSYVEYEALRKKKSADKSAVKRLQPCY